MKDCTAVPLLRVRPEGERAERDVVSRKLRRAWERSRGDERGIGRTIDDSEERGMGHED